MQTDPILGHYVAPASGNSSTLLYIVRRRLMKTDPILGSYVAPASGNLNII